MKLIITKRFDKILRTPHYPIIGFYYCIFELKNQIHITNYPKFYNNEPMDQSHFTSRGEFLYKVSNSSPGLLYGTSSYIPSISSPQKVPVLINEEGVSLSIQLTPDLINKKVDLIGLYALDRFRYLEGKLTGDTMSYVRAKENLSALIAFNPEGSEFINTASNIFKLPISIIRSDLFTNYYDSPEDEVRHHRSSLLNRNTYSIDSGSISNESFIESYSGKRESRERMSPGLGKIQNGTMTIGTDAIQRL